MELDAKNCYLTGEELTAGLFDQFLGSSMMYRIAVELQHGRKSLPV